jgi:predicted transcriptional regulator
MDEPREELKASRAEREDAPDFESLSPPEDVVRGERTRDDFFDAVLTLERPTTAEEVAERADHGVDAAREYLLWFERMGVVTRVTESPATYERNDEYLQWRRVQRLRETYATEELLELLEAETERARSYAEAFDAQTPMAVSISEYADDADRTLAAVWEDVSSWKTARRRIRLLERALATDSEPVPDRQRA